MRYFLGIFFLGWAWAVSAAEQGCLEKDELFRLDYGYETAIRTADTAFLKYLLAEDFIWVHNLAVEIETKSILLERLASRHYQPPAARDSDSLTVRYLKNTAVLTGYTTVKRPDTVDAAGPQSRYHFMRTYVRDGDQCRLLANKTVKVWSSEP